MLVISIAVGLVPFDPERVVALRAVSQATFKRPVRLGDTLHVEGRIAELYARVGGRRPGRRSAWSVVNQDERCVCRARVDVLWRRDIAELETESAVNGEFVPIPL